MKFKIMVLFIILLSCIGCAYASDNGTDIVMQDNINGNLTDGGSDFHVPDMEYTYHYSGSVNVSADDDDVISANVVNHTEAIVSVENRTVFVSGLDAGEYSLNVSSDKHILPVYSKIIVNKYMVDLKPQVTDLYYANGGFIEGHVNVTGTVMDKTMSFSSFHAEIEGEDLSKLIVNGSCINFKDLKPYNTYVLLVNLTESNYEGYARVSLTVNPGRTKLIIPDIVFDWGNSGTVNVITNASGILLNDSDYSDFVSIDGKSISVDGLAVGEYNITFVTSDKDYDNVYGTCHVNVVPVPSILHEISDFTYDWTTGYISVDYDYAVNVTANVIDHNEAVINVSNKIIVISNLDAGDYVLNVSTVPDYNHSSVSQSINFKVKKIDCPIVFSVDDVKYNYNPLVVFDVPSTACGVINVYFKDNVYHVNLSNHENSVTLPLLDVGEYSLFAHYLGDANYNPCTLASKTFNVSYYTASDLQEKINKASSGVLELNENYDFKSDDNSVIINSSVMIDFNGHVINANNISCIFNISADNVGLVNAVLTNCIGDAVIDSHADATVLRNIIFENNNALCIHIQANQSVLDNITVKYSNNAIVVDGNHMSLSNFYLLNNSGRGLILNGNYSNINHVNASGNNDSCLVVNGNHAEINNSLFMNNNAPVIIVNGEDTTIHNVNLMFNQASSIVLVNGNRTEISDSIFSNNTGDSVNVAKDLNCSIDEFTKNHGGEVRQITQFINVSCVVDSFDVKITMKLNALNGTVYAIVDNKLFDAEVYNGSCILNLNYLPVGDYNLTLFYNSTENYSNAESNVSFSVFKQPVSVVAVNKVYVVNHNRSFTVSLSPKLVGKDVVFTFNGKKYSAKTNGNGVAVFSLAKVVASGRVTVSFNGDDRYFAGSANVKITINKEKPVLKVKSKKSFKKNAVKKVKVTLKDSKGKFLKGKMVYISISKYSLKVKTTSKGVAIFKLKNNFKTKKYTYKVVFKGDKYFKKVIKKGFFKVK